MDEDGVHDGPVAQPMAVSAGGSARSSSHSGRMSSSDDGQRFAAEIEPLLPLLYRMALRLTGDRQGAEDLLQDTLERAFVNYGRFEPGTNVRAWLHRTMHNLWIGVYRSRVSRPRVLSLDLMEHASSAGSTRQQGRPANGVESIVLSHIAEEEIFSAVEGLPAEFRKVVSLADVEQLDYKDIAALLRIPLGTVASRLYRGRRRLQQVLRVREVDDVLLSASA